jgi:small subunit ribosomal protein S20
LEEVPLANTHAAEKADRQNARRRVRNRIIRAGARTQVKTATAVIVEGNVADAETATLKALSALDKAAQKGIIKKNNASRRKSRLMKKLNTLRTEKK